MRATRPTTPRQTLLTRARIATAGVVIAAVSATGALTVAAAHASPDVGAPTTTDGSGSSTPSGGSSGPAGPTVGGIQSPSGPVAGSHSS